MVQKCQKLLFVPQVELYVQCRQPPPKLLRWEMQQLIFWIMVLADPPRRMPWKVKARKDVSIGEVNCNRSLETNSELLHAFWHVRSWGMIVNVRIFHQWSPLLMQMDLFQMTQQNGIHQTVKTRLLHDRTLFKKKLRRDRRGTHTLHIFVVVTVS